MDAAILKAFSSSRPRDRSRRERDLDVDDRVAGEHAVRRCLRRPSSPPGELARHHAALDGIDELEALALLLRLDLELDVAVLALAAGLAHELAFDVFDRRRIVSRYATWGLPTLASTPNSRFMRSTMISRCSSPMPEMMVWPDSSSVRTRSDGSSCARRPRATPIFSWSALVLGSTACEITGSGNSIFSSVMMASDRTASRRSSRPSGPRRRRCRPPDLLDLLALVGVHLQMRPMRSFLPRIGLWTESPDLSTPEYTRTNVSWPTYGSVMSLNASAANFSLSSALRDDFLVVFVMAGHRRDVDRRRHELDHRVEHALHALVLERGTAEHRLDLAGDGAQAQAALDLRLGQLARLEVLVHELFAGFDGRFDHVLAPLVHSSSMSAGISR